MAPTFWNQGRPAHHLLELILLPPASQPPHHPAALPSEELGTDLCRQGHVEWREQMAQRPRWVIRKVGRGQVRASKREVVAQGHWICGKMPGRRPSEGPSFQLRDLVSSTINGGVPHAVFSSRVCEDPGSGWTCSGNRAPRRARCVGAWVHGDGRRQYE